MPRVYTTNYPGDETLVQWAIEASSLNDLAARIGVRRESLRDYLSRRPALRERVREEAMRPPLTDEQKKVHLSRARKAWREAHPEKVREINRRWAKNQEPENRARWNVYNRERRRDAGAGLMTAEDLEFAGLVRKDPCVYFCSGPSGTLEHIVPIASGGTSSWTNLAGACQSCNASKNDTSLLRFLLRKVA